MKKAVLTLIASIILVLAVSCSQNQHQPNKNLMPVTTNSDSAAAHYVNAYDIFHYKGMSGIFTALDKALEKDPNFFMAYTLKAFLHNFRRDTVQFEKAARQALECNIKFNDSEKVWKEILEAKLADSGADVLSIAQQFVDFYPDVPEAYLNLGYYYSVAGEKEKAVETYKKAVELAAENPWSYVNLGYALMDLERYDEAREVFSKYMEMLPDAPNAFDCMGDYYSNIGDYKSAYENYMKAHELGWGDRKAQRAKEKMEEAGRSN